MTSGDHDDSFACLVIIPSLSFGIYKGSFDHKSHVVVSEVRPTQGITNRHVVLPPHIGEPAF